MPTRLVQLIVRARDEASRVLTRIGGGLRTLTTIAGVGSAVAVGVTLTRAFRNAIAVGAEFEQRLSRVRAITQATGPDMVKLGEQAKKLGAETVFAARQAADAQTAFALAGFRVNEILSVLPATLSLAAAGELEMAEAAGIVSDIVRSFGQETEDVAHTIDLLAGAASRSNQTVRDIGEAMRFAAPAAKTAGAEISDVVATLALLANRGQRASIAGTGVGNAFATILAATKKTEGPLAAIADQLFDAEGRFVGMARAIEIMRAEGITAGDAMEIFGKRSGRAMAILLDVGPQALRETRAELESLTGFADQVATVKLDNLRGDTVRLASAWESLSIELFEKARPALRAVTAGLTEAVTAMTEAVRTNDDLQLGVEKLVLSVGDAVTIGVRVADIIQLVFRGVEIAVNKTLAVVSGAVGLIVLDIADLSSRLAEIAKGFHLGPVQREFAGLAEELTRLSVDMLQATTGLSAFGDDAAEAAATAHLELQALAEAMAEAQRAALEAAKAREKAAADSAREAASIGKLSEELLALRDAAAAAGVPFRQFATEHADAIEALAQRAKSSNVQLSESAQTLVREVREALGQAAARTAEAIAQATSRLEDALEGAGRITRAQAARISEELLAMAEAARRSEVPFADFAAAAGEDLDDLVARARASRIELSAELRKLAADVGNALASISFEPLPERPPVPTVEAPAIDLQEISETEARLGLLRAQIAQDLAGAERTMARVNELRAASQFSGEEFLARFTAQAVSVTELLLALTQQLTYGIGQAFGDVIFRTRELGEVARDVLEQLGRMLIQFAVQLGVQQLVATAAAAKAQGVQHAARLGALAAETYGAAFAATAAIPFVGPALAPAVAAAATATMLGGAATSFAAGSAIGAGQGATQLFQSGGVVEGEPGVDRLHARLGRGETVLDTLPSEGRAILGGRAAVVPSELLEDLEGVDAGGGLTVIFPIVTPDAAGVRELFVDSGELIVDSLRRAQRLGRLGSLGLRR